MGSHASRTFRLSNEDYARIGALADAKAKQKGEKVTRTSMLLSMCEDAEARLIYFDGFQEAEYQAIYNARLSELEGS